MMDAVVPSLILRLIQRNCGLNPVKLSSADATIPIGCALHPLGGGVIEAFSRLENICFLTSRLRCDCVAALESWIRFVWPCVSLWKILYIFLTADLHNILQTLLETFFSLP